MYRLSVSFCVISCFMLIILAAPVTAADQKDESLTSTPPVAQETPPPLQAVAPTNLNTAEQTIAPADNLVILNPLSEPADLVIRNRKIITLHADAAGLTPRMRVNRLQDHFSQAVSGSLLEEPVVQEYAPYGVIILINKTPVVSIAHLDIDPLDNKSFEQVVSETLKTYSQIIAEVREERSTRAMVKAGGISLVATLILVLAIGLLEFIRRWLLRTLENKLTLASDALNRLTQIDVNHTNVIIRRIITFVEAAIAFFLFFTWLAFILKQFPYTRPWGEGVWTYVLGTFRSMGLVIVSALPNLFKISLIFLIARMFAKLAKLLFEAAESGRIQIPGVFPETADPTRRVMVAIIYIFALVACYPYLPGSGSDAFKGISVLLGVMISLGGSGVINQAMSGLVLMFTRAHHVGDYVRIGDTEGVVTALDMLATKIRTSKREEITIPNSVVLGTSTNNFSRLAGKDGVILHTTVTIGYSAPWRKIHQLLISAADRTTGLKKQPAAFVMQTALSDFYVEYQLNAYLVQTEMRRAVLSELHANIQDTFNEAGVAIVSPHYEADPPEPMPPMTS